MALSPVLVVLFFATLSPSVATGIEELLGRTSAVVEGAVVRSQVSGSVITLDIEVSSVMMGSVTRGDTVTVECNTLKYVFQGINPQPWAYPQIFFLRSTAGDRWVCIPVDMRGYSALGYLGYPQAPPCLEGDLQFLGARSVRERILTRVAESALCGARPEWPRVLDASSPWLTVSGSPGSPPINGASAFDRRLFRALVNSPRRDLHIEAIQALIQLGDPLPFDLLSEDPSVYQKSKVEWAKIRNTIETTLRDPSIIPRLVKLLSNKDSELQLAAATALQRLHTPAAVVLLGKILETQHIEKPLALIAAKGLAEFANGCPMTTQDSLRSPAAAFSNCDEKAAFRTDETMANTAPRTGGSGDDDWYITFWRNWWLANGSRVAALAAK